MARKVRIRTRIKRHVRQQARRKLALHCGSCGKRYANPLGHVCVNSGDFKRRAAAHKRRGEAAERRRKAAASRQRETAARRARRAKETAGRKARRAKEDGAARARRKAPASRPAARQHDYRNCRGEDCERPLCAAWREAYAEGFSHGSSAAAGQ